MTGSFLKSKIETRKSKICKLKKLETVTFNFPFSNTFNFRVSIFDLIKKALFGNYLHLLFFLNTVPSTEYISKIVNSLFFHQGGCYYTTVSSTTMNINILV